MNMIQAWTPKEKRNSALSFVEYHALNALSKGAKPKHLRKALNKAIKEHQRRCAQMVKLASP